ncbi:LytR/AlgR family response regulator transcription factor [Cesiribacter andamanensis]|uniref:Sensory transduction protein lytR n=1 Tax=Cesiribacter andamanensis AMV16 TaxID=1279009 RepID=M7NJ90_9BACT|nr:LytTR family DNA-binding domain-containing protein [Cesiribacter andamanensis]EMR01835.1 Sensory transduction protein lytR [Cesiribacter andamanensis AMV16]
MKVIIIEDEKPAYEKLVHFLKRYSEQTELIGSAQSIEAAVPLLQERGQQADLLLMDIQLADGLSFAALDQVPLKKPVIFITAYNQYALEAFRANGIDYLLKPLTYEAFSASLDKLKQLSGTFADPLHSLQDIYKKLSKPQYKERFLVKIGDHIHSVPTEQIQLFYAEGRNTYLVTASGRRMITDYKLETIEEMVAPEHFFRVNRSYILKLSGIKDVLVYSNSRLKINPNFEFKEEIIVSREKVAPFKDWFGGGR